MAIQDYKVSEAYSGRDIASLSDRPNQDGMTAAQLKARFDQLGKEVIPNYNDLIDLLDSYISTNDNDILALENAINGLGISLGDLGISVQEVLDAYNGGFLSGVKISTIEPTDDRIKVWIDPTEDGIVIDEANRVAQENVRQANETIRISSENTRVSNENTRISNENTRISQENARNVYENYNPLTPYVVGNKVSYNGSSYVCIINSTNNLPTNSTYWLLIASKGDQGIQGEVSLAQLNAGLANKADKLFATNLITNGDFSNGITGWTTNGTVVNGEISLNTASAIALNTPVVSTNGSKYYVAIDAYHDGTSGIITFKNFGASAVSNILSFTLTAIKTRYSGILTNTANGTVLDFARGGAGGVIKLDNIIEINLTAIFGAGKEPTKEQMDWLLAQKFTNSWFNGTAELTSITDLLTLVNTKADKTQEAWITPTLLNGATTGTVTPQYYKDQFGVVRFKGNVRVTNYTLEFIDMPVGYRMPIMSIVFPAWQFTANIYTRVTAADGRKLTAPNMTNNNIISLDAITYKAEG